MSNTPTHHTAQTNKVLVWYANKMYPNNADSAEHCKATRGLMKRALTMQRNQNNTAPNANELNKQTKEAFAFVWEHLKSQEALFDNDGDTLMQGQGTQGKSLAERAALVAGRTGPTSVLSSGSSSGSSTGKKGEVSSDDDSDDDTGKGKGEHDDTNNNNSGTNGNYSLEGLLERARPKMSAATTATRRKYKVTAKMLQTKETPDQKCRSDVVIHAIDVDAETESMDFHQAKILETISAASDAGDKGHAVHKWYLKRTQGPRAGLDPSDPLLNKQIKTKLATAKRNLVRAKYEIKCFDALILHSDAYFKASTRVSGSGANVRGMETMKVNRKRHADDAEMSRDDAIKRHKNKQFAMGVKQLQKHNQQSKQDSKFTRRVMEGESDEPADSIDLLDPELMMHDYR